MSSSRAGYQQLSQSIDEEPDDLEDIEEGLPRGRRPGRSGSIDLTKLDNAFKRWTESIAQKVKRKKKAPDHSKKEIWRTVFDPPHAPTVSLLPLVVKTLDHKPPMTQDEFDVLVQSVRSAILDGIHPKMITKGSSGSYFARVKNEGGKVQTVAVFKPKDEEPYGRLNPKTTKWLHRQLRWIIPFGRACLIPNLSYISEAAASLLDTRMDLHIVPPTQLVSLSSPVSEVCYGVACVVFNDILQAFFYDWIDRTAAKKGKPLPEKIGSMQYFLHGYQDASDFLRKHPWPGRAISDTFDDSTHRRGGVTKRFSGALNVICGRTGEVEDYDDMEYEDGQNLFDEGEDADPNRPFYWSPLLQQSFREELEKLVILDYLMLNTDRGADNYMIKYCEGIHEKGPVDVAPSRNTQAEMPTMRKSELRPDPTASSSSFRSNTPQTDYTRRPHIHIAAIDNSLSFPHEHPQGWRSYTYGWLYLPVSIIAWWEETTFQLRKLFAVDPDFHPKMFARQLAVIKGQAWNIVQSLRHNDEGPLELTRRQKVLVWDDEIDVPEETLQETSNGPPSSPKLSISSVPLPRRKRSRSSSSEFPPPIRRTSTDVTGAPRPVPFAAKFQRIHPGTTGVTILEHLERLDAVEASLQRLGVDEDEFEEVDVGEASQPVPIPSSAPATSTSYLATSPFSPPGSPLPTVQEVDSLASSMVEEDLVAMTKSTTFVESSNPRHMRWSSQAARSIDWMQSGETPPKRTVIVERLETVNIKPLCSCW
ncbi:hypothetical protein ONZ45_g8016 [Pleurotus djamor]|nr:hypothetical protein ONZ45_g8016 [Pleurotus djamor]